jgi:predicted nucleic-acid-binding Zn-ribbon protein
MFRSGTKCAVCGERSKTADFETVGRRFKTSFGDPVLDVGLCPRCGCVNSISTAAGPGFWASVKNEAKKWIGRTCPGCGISDWRSQFSSVLLSERGDERWYSHRTESTWEYQHVGCGYKWTEVHQHPGADY